jgi:hypothetical protein
MMTIQLHLNKFVDGWAEFLELTNGSTAKPSWVIYGFINNSDLYNVNVSEYISWPPPAWSSVTAGFQQMKLYFNTSDAEYFLIIRYLQASRNFDGSGNPISGNSNGNIALCEIT